MPYRSKAQLRYMHAKHPKIAKEWDKEYGVPKNLPEKVGDKMPRKKGTALAKAATAAYEKVKAKTKPGEGGRFKALTKAITAKGGVENPEAVAAVIGRKKYGKKKMESMAEKGKGK